MFSKHGCNLFFRIIAFMPVEFLPISIQKNLCRDGSDSEIICKMFLIILPHVMEHNVYNSGIVCFNRLHDRLHFPAGDAIHGSQFYKGNGKRNGTC